MGLRIIERFKELEQVKRGKVSLMKVVEEFIDPSDTAIATRHYRQEQGMGHSRSLVSDVSVRNALEDYTLESLVDVINPFEAWFTLNVKNVKDTNEEQIREWNASATQEFFTFINESSYYSKIPTDKGYYDLHGFTGLSFIKSGGELKIHQEDPFHLVMSPDMNELYWLRNYTLFEMQELFKYGDKEEDKHFMYQVLCATIPNKMPFIKGLTGNLGKKDFVQVFALFKKFGKEEYETYSKGKKQGDNFGQDVMDEQLNKIVSLSKPFTVVVRDKEKLGYPYGQGWGKKLLVQSRNLNQLRSDLLNVSAYYGDPAVIVPVDILGQFKTDCSGNPHS